MLLKIAKTMRPNVLLTILILIQATVALGGYFYLIKKPMASHSQLTGEYERLLITVSGKAALERQLIGAQQTLAEAKTSFDDYLQQQQAPSSATAISTIAATATARQVDLLSISPLPLQSADFLNASLYRLEARGKFEHVARWLQELEASLPGLTISKLNMAQSADGAQIAVTAELLSYMVNEDSSA